MLATTAVQALAPPPASLCTGRANDGPYALTEGFFEAQSGSGVPSGTIKNRIFLQPSAPGVYEVKLFTMVANRPVWYVTRPFSLNAGSAQTKLYKRTQDAEHGPSGVETEVGELAISLKAGLASSVALSFVIEGGGGMTSSVGVSACYNAIAHQGTLRARGIYEKYDTQRSYLNEDYAVNIHSTTSNGLILLSIFDTNRQPLWLQADGAGSVLPLKLHWRAADGAARNAQVGQMQLPELGASTSTFGINVSDDGGPVTIAEAGGFSLLWIDEPAQYVAQRDGATISAIPQCPNAQIQNISIGSPVTCPVLLRWDMANAPEGSRIVRIGELGARTWLPGPRASAGVLQDITPNQQFIYRILAPSLGTHPDELNYGEVIASSSNVRVTAVNNEVYEGTVPPNLTCGGGQTSSENPIPQPGRWRDLDPSKNNADVSSSRSWDIEVRHPGSTELRFTLHGHDHSGRPVWLRSEWIQKTAHTYSWRGKLRRYRWHPMTKAITAGAPVGQFIAQHTARLAGNNSAVIPAIRMFWSWEGADRGGSNVVTDDCLTSEVIELPAARSAAASARMVYNGVWAPWPGRADVHTDTYSMLIRPVILGNEIHYDEQLIARLFDIDYQPVWLTSPRIRVLDYNCNLQEWLCNLTQVHNQQIHKFPMFLRHVVNPAYSKFSGYLERTLFVHGYDIGQPQAFLKPVFDQSIGTTGVYWVRPRAETEYHSVMPDPPHDGVFASKIDSGLSADNSVITAGPRVCILPGNNQPACPVHVAWRGGQPRSSGDWRVVRRNLDPGTAGGSGETVIWTGTPGTNNYRGIDALAEPNTTFPLYAHYVLQHLAPSGWTDSAVSTIVAITQLGDLTPPVLSRSSNLPVPVNSSVNIQVSGHSTSDNVYLRRLCPDGTTGNNQFINVAPPANAQIGGCGTAGVMHVQAFRCETTEPYRCSGLSNTWNIVVGTEQPQAPTNFVATVDANGVVNLSWTASVNFPLSGSYQIHRAVAGGVLELDGNAVPGNQTTTTRSPGSGTWSFIVRACLSSGVCSPPSQLMTVFVPLQPPASLSAVSAEALNYTLSWPEPTGSLSHYELRQGTDSSGAGAVAMGGVITARTYSGSVPSAGQWYFWVRACASASSCSSWRISAPLTLPVPATLSEIPDDEYGTRYNPAVDDYRSSQASSIELAGALSGEAGVVGGTATYSIPIAIPPGRRGMQPQLSIDYSSRSGNGVLGMGFGLSAGGAISRCPSTLATDGVNRSVRFDGNDQLCLDGQRLIAQSSPPSGASAWYKTEIDSQARVLQYGSLGDDAGLYFMVQAKDGMVHYYGADARANGAERGARVKPEGIIATSSWLLNSSYDPSQNNVRYTYTVYGKAENLLTLIKYTGGVAGDGDREVRLGYAARPDRSNSYQALALSEQTQKLEWIETRVGSKKIKRYDLTLLPSEYSGRLLLREVRECGFAGALTQCLPPTRFSWHQDAQSVQFRRVDMDGLPQPATNGGDVALRDRLREVLDQSRTSYRAEASVLELLGALNVSSNMSGYAYAELQAQLGNLINPLGDLIQSASLRPWADFDGDGARDALYTHRGADSRYDVLLVRLDADRVIRDWVDVDVGLPAGTFWISGLNTQPQDIDSDGRADLIYCDGSCQVGDVGGVQLRAISWQGDWNLPVSAAQLRSRNLDVPGLDTYGRYVTSVRFMDLNGDGRVDLLLRILDNPPVQDVGSYAVAYSEGIDASGDLKFSPISSIGYFDVRPSQLRDVNGDGVLDLYFDSFIDNHHDFHQLGVRLGSVVGSVWQLAAVETSCEALFDLKVACTSQNFGGLRWLDVNGDGLEDVVYQGGPDWKLRLNKGGVLGAEHVVSDPAAQANPIGEGIPPEPIRPDVPVLVSDLDSDGRSELLEPYAHALVRCDWSTFVDPPQPGQPDSEPYTAYACPQPLPDEFSWLVPTGLNGRPARAIRDDAAGTMDVRYAVNSSLYRWKTTRFKLQPDGTYQLVVDTSKNWIAPLSTLDGAVAPDDFFGDGLTDWGYYNVCMAGEQHLPGQTEPQPPLCAVAGIEEFSEPPQWLPTYPTPEPTAALATEGVMFISENRGADSSNAGQPAMPESLHSVTDALGNTSRWSYAPLSGTAGRTATQIPLYRIPARNSGAGYVDDNHIYFSSSMYVVESFFQSNGVGGENVTRYGYEEAMYNLRGRGFVGFRRIITENEFGAGSNALPGLRQAITYEQKFPLVSRPVCDVTQLVTEPWQDLSCAQLPGVANKLLSRSVVSDYSCNGAPCNQSNPTLLTSWRVVSGESLTQRYDLTDRAMLITSGSTSSDYDSFNNLIEQRTQTLDYQGTQLVRDHQSTTTHTFEYSASTWWINKLTSTRSTVEQSYGPGHSTAPDTIPERSTLTLYDYDDTHRLPNCEELRISDTATQCGDRGDYERRVVRAFDSYGNVSSETSRAREQDGVRVVHTSYQLNPGSANATKDGYFPTRVTDVNSRYVSSGFDEGFGVATSVTDANGLISTVSLDALGRPVRAVAPEVGALKAAMPTITAYERCGVSGVSCSDSRAVMRVVSSQYGSPQSITYADSMGRTIRTSTKLFNAPYAPSSAALDDIGASVADVVYNAKGQVLRQYEPSNDGPNLQAFTDFEYDILGRVTTKWQGFNRVDADQYVAPDPLATAPNSYRRTDYQHVGLQTTIRVCQVLAPSTACVGSGGNPDTSPQLTMHRSYDSAERLLRTVDAKGGETFFWFDGAGNPLWVRDVMEKLTGGVYTDFGQRIHMTDPSSGTWQFHYNGYGEMLWRIDGRRSTAIYKYDQLGRLYERSWDEPSRINGVPVRHEERTQYNDASTTAYGTVRTVERITVGAAVSDQLHWQRTYQHDALARPTLSITSMVVADEPTVQVSTRTRYDSKFGRVKQMDYPGSAIDSAPISLYQYYNHNGVLLREGFVADYLPQTPWSSDAIRVLTGVDGRGLTTGESFGVRGTEADWRSSNFYDPSGWLLAQCVSVLGTCDPNQPSSGTRNQPLDQRYRFDVYGNLRTQWHNGNWISGGAALNNQVQGRQGFEYDALQRLRSSTRVGAFGPSNSASSTTVQYDYNAIGGLLHKTDYSSTGEAYSYASTSHRLLSVQLAAGGTASYGYDANGNVTLRTENGVQTALDYDIDNLPRRISRAGLVSEFYEAQGGRFLQRLRVNGQITRDTWSLEKTYEREMHQGSVSLERYYLSGGTLLTIKPGEGRKLSYLHSDRLGSPVSITEKQLPANGKLGNAAPTLVEHRGFDAFGKALDGVWGTSNGGMVNLAQGQLYNFGKRNQRGFTGHEHLDEFALIHMNGRAYDYNLGRFLGVDPIIQFPANSQSLNPYSYLMNNPLSGTDPTGYCSETAVDREKNEVSCTFTAPGTRIQTTAIGSIGEGGRVRFTGQYATSTGNLTIGGQRHSVSIYSLTVSNGAQQSGGNHRHNGITGSGTLARERKLDSIGEGRGRTNVINDHIRTMDEAKDKAWEDGDDMGRSLGRAAWTGITYATCATPAVLACRAMSGSSAAADGDHLGVVTAGSSGRAAPARIGSETFYRAMTPEHYKQLLASGKLPATGETFISPTKAFAANYDGVLVQFSVRGGTTAELARVGVRDFSSLTALHYGQLPRVSRGWTSRNALFKAEGGSNPQINIGLGRGAGLNVFNANIIDFRAIPK